MYTAKFETFFLIELVENRMCSKTFNQNSKSRHKKKSRK